MYLSILNGFYPDSVVVHGASLESKSYPDSVVFHGASPESKSYPNSKWFLS